MRVLLTGVSGYLGARLAPRLLADGHDVRGFARDPARVSVPLPVIVGDAVTGTGLRQALSGIDVAYYLIHSMEPAAAGRFEACERSAAENFAAEARAAGVGRLIYLGGLCLLPKAMTSPYESNHPAIPMWPPNCIFHSKNR